MPIMIVPGTVSASILAGQQLQPLCAVIAMFLVVGLVVIIMIGLKILHDIVRTRNEPLIERYVAGRLYRIILIIDIMPILNQQHHS